MACIQTLCEVRERVNAIERSLISGRSGTNSSTNSHSFRQGKNTSRATSGLRKQRRRNCRGWRGRCHSGSTYGDGYWKRGRTTRKLRRLRSLFQGRNRPLQKDRGGRRRRRRPARTGGSVGTSAGGAVAWRGLYELVVLGLSEIVPAFLLRGE